MEYTSIFDIIGPIMVGPSSSHTAGALQIAKHARGLLGTQPLSAEITLYNSFAKTHKGHSTDVAIIGGILDFDTDDENIPFALQIAKDLGIDFTFILTEDETLHPNTAKIILKDNIRTLEIEGKSIGGGAYKINYELWDGDEFV